MLSVLEFLAAPFGACLVLVAMLGYLGLHVLEREIIFVDLALAQIAAFGAVVGLIFGHEPHSAASFGYALGSTVVEWVAEDVPRMLFIPAENDPTEPR